MHFFSDAAAIFLACLTAALAQTSTDCDPTNKTCPADTGLSSSTYTADFTAAGGNVSWTAAAYSEISYGSDGAVFTISKEGQAPTIETDFYIFFGKVEVTMKPAPGQGIVSSIVLESDDLDEIDWEFIGGDNAQVQSNFYGKGNTTTYDRVQYHAVSSPQDTWHTYTIDWNEERINYIIDDSTIRTVEYSEQLTVYGKNYPQTPMRLKLGNWAGGADGNSEGTIEWAGGAVDFDKGPFSMIVRNVSISNANAACSYIFQDTSGDYASIEVVKSGDSCSANTTISSNGSSKTIATHAPTSSHSVAPVKQTGIAATSTIMDSIYTMNSASASALNNVTSSTINLPISVTGRTTTATPLETFAGDAPRPRTMAAGAVVCMLASFLAL